MFFQLVVAKGKLTRDGNTNTVLDPLEAAMIINLLVGFYTARLPRGVAEASEELDVLKHIDGKLLSELIEDIAASRGSNTVLVLPPLVSLPLATTS